MKLKALLIGNHTGDENIVERKKYKTAGGAVYFAGKTFENLGAKSVIISPKFDKPLIFKNIYINGKRKQKVENYRQYLKYDWLANLKQFPTKADIVMIAPVINNITPEHIIKIKAMYIDSFFCLLPQGLFRKIADNGSVSTSDWNGGDEIISCFDFICFSEEDIPAGEKKAAEWSKQGPLVIVTRAEKGASLYKGGKRSDTPAFSPQKFADPTGAGDIFAAAFVFHFLQTKDITDSVAFAHKFAYLSLRKRSNQLQYSQR